jgi:aldehyde:ferredoxin oxidoreductase
MHDQHAQGQAAYTVLAEFEYEPVEVERGYTNRTLYVNLSDNAIASRPVSQQMKDIFIGGRGFGLWLLWNAVHDDTRWDDPENELNIACGPLGGTRVYPGSGKSLVVSISPLTQAIMDSNVGGHFGPLLKFAGWDALEIQGRAEKDVIVLIDGDACKVQIMASPIDEVNTHLVGAQLTRMFADSEEALRDISVVSAGSGAGHTRFGCLNFSWYDARRGRTRFKQAGRGGMGTILRNKRIKALVVKRHVQGPDLNHAADFEQVAGVGKKMNREILELDPQQNRMRQVGTAHLVEIMNDYDLLPTHNFKFGCHPQAQQIDSRVFYRYYTQNVPDGCWHGCTLACSKAVDGFVLQSGPYKGQTVCVDGPEYETIAGCGSNLGIFDPQAIIEINFYCDTYGIDTISFGTATAFAMECYEAGILDAEKTGGLELRFGNAGAALELLHQMGRGEGFGPIVGQGVRRMKALFAGRFGGDPGFMNDIGMESKGLEFSEYVTKESLAMQGGYGLTLKGPQHDEAWLIFMDQVNNQIPTFEDKAEALHYFPMWRTWFGLNGLCKIIWNDVEPEDNALTDEQAKVPEHVRNYVAYFAGVTGRDVQSGDDLIRMSERVYNLQRVFNIRLGYGRRFNDAIPYRSAGPVTEEEYLSRQERYDRQLVEKLSLDPATMSTADKVAALRAYREEQYEKLTDAVYARRGWTRDGVPTVETLRELGIDFPDVVAVVQKYLKA